MPQVVPSRSGPSLSTEGHRGSSRVGMAVQSREQLMNLAGNALASAGVRLYATDGYDRLEQTFLQLAFSSVTLSDEAFLSKWEAFMSSAKGTNATNTRPRTKDE